MRLLVSGATTTISRLKLTPNASFLGQFYVPLTWGEPPMLGLPWAADNGCFKGFDAPLYCRMLDRAKQAPTKPLWVVAPDVVGDARATRDLWPQWMITIACGGLEPCFVLQDGQEDFELPDARAFFVGGTTKFKESKAVFGLCCEAKKRGAALHMGRVNTFRRMRWAAECGCDTIDGSGFSAWPDTRIPKALSYLKQLASEKPMFPVAP